MINISNKQTKEENKLLNKNKIFLKSKKSIDAIFKNGKHISVPPLSAKYLQLNETFALNFVIGVKKKHFPKAVDRNKVKRLMRDSIRSSSLLKNKISEQNKSYQIAIIYNSNIIYEIDHLKDKINLILTRLIYYE